MLCEICGKEVTKTFKVVFDGDIVFACENCMKKYKLRRAYMKPIDRKKTKTRKEPFKDFVLVEGYGSIIRRSREKRGLSQGELAEMVGEKVSVIKKIETEKLIPPDELVKRLMGILKAKLIEEVS